MTTTATTPFKTIDIATVSHTEFAERSVGATAASAFGSEMRAGVSPEASAFGSEMRTGVSPEASAFGSGERVGRGRSCLLSGLVARQVRNGSSLNADLASQRWTRLVQSIGEIAPDENSLRANSTNGGTTSASQIFSRHLLELSNHAERVDQGSPSANSTYTRQLLLSSILPLYLRSSSQPLAKSLSNAIQLVWEHRVMLTLNHLLEGDLIRVIDEEDLSHLSPLDAARHVMEMDLGEVVSKSYDQLYKDQSATSHIHPGFALNTNERDGYWAVAAQWIQQREAISIPASLAVGAVSWQRLRGHWQVVSACLSSTSSSTTAPPGAVATKAVASKAADPLAQPRKNNSQSASHLQDNPVAARATNQPLPESSNAESFTSRQGEIHEQLIASAQESVGQLLPDVIEIRSSNDPELAKNLEVHLQRCRDRSGSLALVVIRCKAKQIDGLKANKDLAKGSLCKWQLDLINTLQTSLEHRKMYGFYTTDGDLALIMEDVDRSEVTSLVRTVIEQEANLEEHETRLLDEGGLPLFSGIACVQAPTKSFRLSQLIESAWRCLEATLRQPPGSVKSIEVY